jgi:hypothetical protein
MLKTILKKLRRFNSDTSGNVSVEFVLAMPFVFWAFMGVYVFFDGYRQSSVNLKAAYTISDLISRETTELNDNYIDSMQSLLQVMTRATSSVKMRVSVLRWDQDEERYYVDWSENRGYPAVHTDQTVQQIEDDLPIMPDNERVILVETRNVFVPLFNVGMENKNLDNFVFTRPRFAPQVAYEGVIIDGGDHDDGTGT